MLFSPCNLWDQNLLMDILLEKCFVKYSSENRHIDTVVCEVKKFSCPQLEFHVTKRADEFPHYTCAGLFSTHFPTRHSLIFRFWILN